VTSSIIKVTFYRTILRSVNQNKKQNKKQTLSTSKSGRVARVGIKKRTGFWENLWFSGTRVRSYQ